MTYDPSNTEKFRASMDATPMFNTLNDFLRKKHKEGITFAVWIYEHKDTGPIIHYTAFPDYKPR
jgi:hypothetical protein